MKGIIRNYDVKLSMSRHVIIYGAMGKAEKTKPCASKTLKLEYSNNQSNVF